MVNFPFKRAWMVLLLMPVFFSCATYNTKMLSYYKQVNSGNYAKALSVLDENSYIQTNRNQLLYFLEKGKVFHLKGNFDSSNIYLNMADKFIENNTRTAKDIALANLTSPMSQTYLGEDFEVFLIHYYKALNYMYLGLPDDAIVEARRITLSTTTQEDKFNNKANRYSKDAFAYNLQGILYETAGDVNNAFIAYRNAADVYLNANGTYYGVSLPLQLQKDVLKMAQQMGFTSEYSRYANLFKINTIDSANDGELVIFAEEGLGPVKKEQNFVIANSVYGNGGFYFVDSYGSNVQVPFDYSYYNSLNGNDFKASDLRVFRVAIPAYEIRNAQQQNISASVNNTTYNFQLVENINSLAVNILKERMLKEMANAIARQIVKKLVEKGAEAGATSVAKNNSNEKDDKKKKQNAENVGAVAGLLVNLINTATEQADTRNWQTLPAFINYVKIPLHIGTNTITLQSNRVTKTITVNSNGKLQLYNWCMLN